MVCHVTAPNNGVREKVSGMRPLFNVKPARHRKLFFGLILCLASSAAPALELLRWQPPFSYAGEAHIFDYTPPEKATRPWNLCIVFPHIKDAYWQAVNYGMIDEAGRLGVALRISEAGGYPNIERQRKLIGDCLDSPAVDAIILGTVSFDGLSDTVRRASLRKPVLATVNDIADAGLSAKVGVPYYEMGRLAGRYLVQRYPDTSQSIAVAWFPGPRKAGWVPFVDGGFRDAIRGSAIRVVAVAWGDTDKTVQRNLVQDALDRHPDIAVLAGNAMMAEAAIGILRERGLEEKVSIVATYLTPGVYRGIARRKVLAAPTDSPVVQGRLSIDQAVALLERKRFEKHMGPVIRVVDRDHLEGIQAEDALPPPTFLPQFRFDPVPTTPR